MAEVIFTLKLNIMLDYVVEYRDTGNLANGASSKGLILREKTMFLAKSLICITFKKYTNNTSVFVRSSFFII